MTHKAIQIRDQLATTLANTSLLVYTSRGFALDGSNVPYINIMIGQGEHEFESLDNVEVISQLFTIELVCSSSDDIDAELYARTEVINDALIADRELGGLVHDILIVSTAPSIETGDTKYGKQEIMLMVVYTN